MARDPNCGKAMGNGLAFIGTGGGGIGGLASWTETGRGGGGRLGRIGNGLEKLADDVRAKDRLT